MAETKQIQRAVNALVTSLEHNANASKGAQNAADAESYAAAAKALAEGLHAIGIRLEAQSDESAAKGTKAREAREAAPVGQAAGESATTS